MLIPRRLDEDEKVKIAKELNIHYDPLGPADTATIVCGFIITGMTYILLIFAAFHSKYPPIRSKNLRLTFMMHFSATIWLIGNVPANMLVPLVGAWSECKVWGIWFRIAFAYMFSACLFMRIYALHCVFNKRKPFHGWSLYIPLAIISACILIFCIVTQIVDDRLIIWYYPKFEVCIYTKAFSISSLVLLWAIWAAIGVMWIMIRNIHSSFNEKLESFIVGFIALICLLQVTISHAIKSDHPFYLSLRMLNAWTDIVSTNLAIWVLIGPPVYQYIFHRTEYLNSWMEKLTRDGLKKEYEVDTPTNTHNTSRKYTRVDDMQVTQLAHHYDSTTELNAFPADPDMYSLENIEYRVNNDIDTGPYSHKNII